MNSYSPEEIFRGLMNRLNDQQLSIYTSIEGLDESQLKQRLIPDKWSAFENLVHVIAYQPTFLERIKLILENNEPGFERYVAENDPRFHEHLQLSLPGLIQIGAEYRNEIIQLLSSLNNSQLSRKGKHPKYGEMTLLAWLDFFLLHEAHHLFNVFMYTNQLRMLSK